MSLPSETCRVCREKHLLMRNGEMSIHTDKAGQRCAGSGDPQAHIKRQARAERERERQELRQRQGANKKKRDYEREEAYAVAQERAFRKYVSAQMKPNQPLDRKIYAVGGVRTVSGGLPTHGRRH